MKMIAACLAAMVAVGLECAAQDTRAAGSTAPIVVTGCINRQMQTGSLASNAGVPPATPSTAPVLANSSEPTNSFVLNGVPPPDADKPGAEGAKAPAPPTSYALDGKPEQFEPHNGHHVEITGTISGEDPAQGSPETKSNVKHLRVSAIRMLSATCPKPADAAKPAADAPK